MSYSKLSMSLLVKYSQIFPGEPINVETLLRPYGRKLTLQMVAVLNATLQKGIKEAAAQLRSWFGQDNPLALEMFKLVFEGYKDALLKKENVYIINDYSNLRLNIIGSSFDEIDAKVDFPADTVHMDLFKAYLWLNEEYLLQQENISATLPEGTTGFEKAGWMATATLLSYYDFTYSNEPYIFLAQLIKAHYCFEFIAAYHPEVYQLYLNSLKIGSFNDYAKKITPLVNLCFTDLVSFNAKEVDDQAFLELYNHLQGIEENQDNKEHFDFIQIRNSPIIKIDDELYLLLNRSMVVNKVYTSIYWDLKDLFAKNPDFGISKDRFRSDYTTDFSEGYLAYKLLQKAYGNKKYKQFSGTEMKKYVKDTEPDYYIRNGNKLFIYEVKDSFIAGKFKQSFDVTEIKEELKRKYFGKDGPGKEKAVKQLITRIRQSLLKAYPFDDQYNTRSLNIYPILLVYDINLTVPGMERALIKMFSQEVETLNKEMVEQNIKGYRINDIVVLHIDGLAILSEYIYANKLKLEDLIDSYQERYRKLLKLTDGKTFEEIKANVLTSFLSFQHYIMDSVMKIKPNDRSAPRELMLLE